MPEYKRGTLVVMVNHKNEMKTFRLWPWVINWLKGSNQVKKTKASKPPSDEYQRFEKLVKALISVPKSEIDKRQAQYDRKKAAKKRKAA